MGQPTIVTGRINNFNQHANVYEGQFNIVKTRRFVSFRVDNRPVQMLGMPNMADGDQATVAGWDKGGELKGFAIRNHTTGVIYTLPTKKLRNLQYLWLVGVIFLVKCTSDFGAGGFLGALLLSVPFVAASLWVRGQYRAIAGAIQQVEMSPATLAPSTT